MISPGVSNQKQANNANFKLPKIESKHNIDSSNRKKSPQTDRKLLKLKVQFIGQQKQNIYTQSLRKVNHQRQNNIKEGLEAIKQVQQKVKNLFGDPEATLNIGGQMTNFDYKVDINREIIKNFRNQNQIKVQPAKFMNKVQQIYKNKSLTFKQSNKGKQQKSLKKVQINLKENFQQETPEQVQKNHMMDVLNFKSQRKVKIQERTKNKSNNKKKDQNQIQECKNQTVFVSIKQILDNPCKNQNEKQSKIHLAIRQLESKLKKMSSYSEKEVLLHRKQSQNLKSNKEINSPQQSVRDWMKVQFCNQKKSLKCLKSNFDEQFNHINALQQKSYKSIENMVQNRKMLIQLNMRSQLRKP